MPQTRGCAAASRLRAERGAAGHCERVWTTNGRLLVVEELAAHESQHQRRLPDGTLAQENQLELEGFVLRRHRARSSPTPQ
jgi:hypothetical protein